MPYQPYPTNHAPPMLIQNPEFLYLVGITWQLPSGYMKKKNKTKFTKKSYKKSLSRLTNYTGQKV